MRFKKVLELKGRDVDKGFILAVSSYEMLEPFVKPVTQEQQDLLDAYWPGPVTYLMPVADEVPELLTGGRKTIAVRMSAHPVLAGLVEAYGKPIISTSANVSAAAPARTYNEIKHYFGDNIRVVEGELGKLSQPTSIIDLETLEKIR